MFKQYNTNKKRFIVSISIMVLALVALIGGVVAWFSMNRTAEVDNINVRIERKALNLLSEITTIDFPCATKLYDTTAELFNKECVVEKTYIFDGEGKLQTSVNCDESPGMIGYVCDSVNTTDYYTEIMQKLEGKKIDDFSDLKEAIHELNHDRGRFGDLINGDTHIKIVYWVEYDEVESDLQSQFYQELSYIARITFVA